MINRQAPSFIPTVGHVECMGIGSTPNTPWYADIANYLAADVQPNHLKQYTKKRFFRELRRYFWDEPYLYKHCSDGMYKGVSLKLRLPRYCFIVMDLSMLDILQLSRQLRKYFKLDFGGLPCLMMLMLL
ncbi:hypothetical protein V5N11_008333 [Cardamine amara subsp. amara]|uniref:Uncharacterized protein n=1 Tax=Cardamine amara subsp. amara TaxID=228776 RepID=A0ABD0ZXB2_CARAN